MKKLTQIAKARAEFPASICFDKLLFIEAAVGTLVIRLRIGIRQFGLSPPLAIRVHAVPPGAKQRGDILRGFFGSTQDG